MKTASTVARYILGAIFLVFGLNGFLHFLPMQVPEGLAGRYLDVLNQSHLLKIVYILELKAAVQLLIDRFVPLGIAILAPIVANILFFHLFMAPSGLPLAIVVCVLLLLATLNVRSAFTGIFKMKSPPKDAENPF